MAKQTIRVGPMHLVIDVEQLSDNVWSASMPYKGERFEALSDSQQGATVALLIVLKSEISSGNR